MLDLLEKLINRAGGIVCAYFIYAILREFLQLRKGIVCKLAAIFLLSYVGYLVVFPEEVTGSVGTVLGLTLIVFVFYKGGWVEKLSSILILFPIIVGTNYVTEDVGLLIYVHVFESEMSRTVSTILHSTLLLLRVPVWYFIWKYAKKWIERSAHLMTPKMWLLIDVLCMTSSISIISLVYNTDSAHSYMAYPAAIACILTSVGCCYFCAYIAKTLYAQMEMENLRYQQSYYTELEENQQNIRKLRHDMKNHLNIIGSLVQEKDYGNAEKYLRSLSGEFETSARNFCENKIVNAVLNSKYNRAVDNQIECFFHIDINTVLAIDDVSLCSLFANTLDNAIEACVQMKEVEERKISLKARYKKGCFSYEIINSKEGEIKTENGKIITGKTDMDMHGLGLQKVKDIAERYDGTMEVGYSQKEFTVTVFVGDL